MTERQDEVKKSPSEWFDEGLERYRNQDLQGTMLCWTNALKLDPDNRVYKSNVRKLERHLLELGLPAETK